MLNLVFDYVYEFYCVKQRRMMLAVGAIVSMVGSAFICFSKPVMDGLIRLNEVIPNATDLDKASPEQINMLTLANPAMHALVFNYSNGLALGFSAGMVVMAVAASSFIGRAYTTGAVLYEHVKTPNRVQRWLAKTVSVILASMLYTALLVLCSLPIYFLGVYATDTWGMMQVSQICSNIALSILVMAVVAALSTSLAWIFRNANKPLFLLAGVLVFEQILVIALKFAHIEGIQKVLPITAIKSAIPVDFSAFVPNLTTGESSFEAIICISVWATALLLVSAVSEQRREIPIIT